MERAVRDLFPQLPENTLIGCLAVNITSVILTLGIPPMWCDPRAVIMVIAPLYRASTGSEIILEQNDVVVLEALTLRVTLENSLLHLPFLAKDATVMAISVHPRVLTFKLSVDYLLL